MRRTVVSWLVLVAATVALGSLLGLAAVPSSYLFAALLLGLVVALRWPDRLTLPPPAFSAAQAVTGVVLGAYLQSKSLTAVADSWLAVTLVTAGTLAVCLIAGSVLARTTEMDPPTAALGSVAGGASGIVAMAQDLGGDDRLVAFMQYARVLVVVLLTPIIAGLCFPGSHAGAVPDAGPVAGTAKDWAITLACAPLGALFGRVVRLPAGTLLGPMAIAGALTLTGALGTFTVPPVLREAGFIVIGLQVGLRFTVATVRQVGRLLVPVLLSILALMLACFGLAVLLHLTTSGVSLEDAYLATTPGGLYAVLAVAFGAGANTTFILAVQGLRLLVMVLLAPVVVRRMVGTPATMRA